MRTSQSRCGKLGIHACKELGKIFSLFFVCVLVTRVSCKNLRTQIASNQEGFSFLLVPAKGIPSPSRLQWGKRTTVKVSGKMDSYHCKLLPSESHSPFRKRAWERRRISLVLTEWLRLIAREKMVPVSKQNTCPVQGMRREQQSWPDRQGIVPWL